MKAFYIIDVGMMFNSLQNHFNQTFINNIAYKNVTLFFFLFLFKQTRKKKTKKKSFT